MLFPTGLQISLSVQNSVVRTHIIWAITMCPSKCIWISYNIVYPDNVCNLCKVVLLFDRISYVPSSDGADRDNVLESVLCILIKKHVDILSRQFTNRKANTHITCCMKNIRNNHATSTSQILGDKAICFKSFLIVYVFS